MRLLFIEIWFWSELKLHLDTWVCCLLRSLLLFLVLEHLFCAVNIKEMNTEHTKDELHGNQGSLQKRNKALHCGHCSGSNPFFLYWEKPQTSRSKVDFGKILIMSWSIKCKRCSRYRSSLTECFFFNLMDVGFWSLQMMLEESGANPACYHR